MPSPLGWRPRPRSETARPSSAGSPSRRAIPIEVMILVVADTHANRAAVRAAAESLAEMFPMPARVALRELRAGRVPEGSALILL